MLDSYVAAPFECKASATVEGEFSGYGSVFGALDLAGDTVQPGAFADSIKARGGRPLPMHLNHGLPQLGGRRGIGTWHGYGEDSRGLEVKGRLAGMNTETGRYLWEQMKSGAMSGLSIGFAVAPGGSIKSAGGKRSLTKLNLAEVSIVDDPCCAEAVIHELKAAQAALEGKATSMMAADRDKVAASVASAIRMHDKTMQGNPYDSTMSSKDKAVLMTHLQDAHEALTGQRVPDGMEGWTKSADTVLAEVLGRLERLEGGHKSSGRLFDGSGLFK